MRLEKRFSEKHRTFHDWFSAQKKHTDYVKKIARRHAVYPRASLSELRGQSGSLPQKKLRVSRLPYSILTPREKYLRDRSLEVLSEARRTGKSLTRIAREYGISSDAVMLNTDAFKKKNGRWIPKKYDRISRTMKINENGRESSIEIADSRTASLMGRYHSAVGQFLGSGNRQLLAPFKKRRIKDVQGRYHILETDPEALREINERIEEPEYYEVYSP